MTRKVGKHSRGDRDDSNNLTAEDQGADSVEHEHGDELGPKPGSQHNNDSEGNDKKDKNMQVEENGSIKQQLPNMAVENINLTTNNDNNSNSTRDKASTHPRIRRDIIIKTKCYFGPQPFACYKALRTHGLNVISHMKLAKRRQMKFGKLIA
ncbi:hypothetical protein G7Y89_g7329 [Cudoniella acicularis]|uniref:Uncharacterized protein n=1 Tax=Cudoniella acicularis TaxID=354080 RepID=A0A8H4W3Y0_9HELO|nr:hypothetical protein G7Y89_g7329 [Cudoniella acicularis]